MIKPQYYLVTEDELNKIKNDCEHPETNSCEGCEFDTSEGCKFVGANILMDEVLSRPVVGSATSAEQVLEENLERLKIERDKNFKLLQDEIREEHQLYKDYFSGKKSFPPAGVRLHGFIHNEFIAQIKLVEKMQEELRQAQR